jgi:hypothetical protein
LAPGDFHVFDALNQTSVVVKVSVMTKRLKRSVEVVETTVKRLLCCCFRRTGKAMGQVYHYCGKICLEISVFLSGSNITCFTFYIHLWLMYGLSLVRLDPIGPYSGWSR